MLANSYVGGYATLHKLEFGKTDVKDRKKSFYDLIWSDERKSYLIVNEIRDVVDSKGNVIENICFAEGTDARDNFIMRNPISNTHPFSIFNKLVNSPTYEEISKK